MKVNLPVTPFSTLFSGSAGEIRLRIRSIFQGPKRRMPLPALGLVLLATVFCGYLVSCQPKAAQPTLVMQMQYYDVNQNYIEIPALVFPHGATPTPGAEAINQTLKQLQTDYQLILDGLDSTTGAGFENRCLLYPCDTTRYLSLVFFQNTYQTDMNTGHILSLVYDKEQGVQVTLDDALTMAELTRQQLFDQLSTQIDPTLEQQPPLRVQNPALEGFRMGQDGKPIFYLTARIDDADPSPQADAVSGADHVFIWEGGQFTLYDQYTLPLSPMVPSQELMRLTPPLWCQWYFNEGQPEGGFSDPALAGLSAQERALLDALLFSQGDTGALDDTAPPLGRKLLAYISGDGYTLAAASTPDHYPRYYMVIGAVDNQTGKLLSPIFESTAYSGQPHVAAFQRPNGTPALVYTSNGTSQGVFWGGAGVVTYDGSALSWLWPVVGNVGDINSQASTDYQDYWQNHLALLAPGGVEIFTQNSTYGPYDGSPVQWSFAQRQSFYSTPEDNLPANTLESVRRWLEDFTRDDKNPWNAVNTSACWRIITLAQTKTHYPDLEEGELVLELECLADSDTALVLSATILYDPASQSVSKVVSWSMGSPKQTTPPNQPESEDVVRNQLILNYYQQQYPTSNWYFADNSPSTPQEGDRRIDRVTYAGESRIYETIGVAYQVESSVYQTLRTSADDPGRTDFYSIQSSYLVLSRSGYDDSFQGVFGEANFNTQDKPIEEVIQQVAYGLSDIQVSLWRDGYPNPAGPGTQVSFFRAANGEIQTVRRLEGWEPIYADGDYWAEHSWDGLSAICYHSGQDDSYRVNSVYTTRTDLRTYRGIRVGDSRAQVLAAYPDIFDAPYWDEPEDDYLWYCDSQEGWGAAILFFFLDDTVSSIRLNSVFD